MSSTTGKGEQRRLRRTRFSIGSAPLTSITENRRSNQWWRNPTGLSRYRKFPPGGSLVRSPVPAFRCTGVIPLLWPRLSHSTPDTQFRVGSSLQAGLYARTPRSVRLLRLIRKLSTWVQAGQTRQNAIGSSHW